MLTLAERKSEIDNYEQPNPVGTLASFEVSRLINAMKFEIEALGNELMAMYPVVAACEQLYERTRDQIAQSLATGDSAIDVGEALKVLLDETEAYRRGKGTRA